MRLGRKIRFAFFLTAEKLIQFSILPPLRAVLLRLFGARVGKNTLIYEARFVNVVDGFRNLRVGDGVHIGSNVLLDLTGTITIGDRTSVSAGSIIFSHSDPGEEKGSLLSTLFPRTVGAVQIGTDVWIGIGCCVLNGVAIGDRTVIGAGSVVTSNIPANSIAYGVPAKVVRRIDEHT